jgi:hypothetical protein
LNYLRGLGVRQRRSLPANGLDGENSLIVRGK